MSSQRRRQCRRRRRALRWWLSSRRPRSPRPRLRGAWRGPFLLGAPTSLARHCVAVRRIAAPPHRRTAAPPKQCAQTGPLRLLDRTAPEAAFPTPPGHASRRSGGLARHGRMRRRKSQGMTRGTRHSRTSAGPEVGWFWWAGTHSAALTGPNIAPILVTHGGAQAFKARRVPFVRLYPHGSALLGPHQTVIR